MSAQQIPLDLSFPPALAEKDFVVGEGNHDALAWIRRWPDWPGNALALFGPEGSGKTHLSHIWRARAKADLLDTLPQDVVRLGPALILESPKNWHEQSLLHLFNRQREEGGFLLLIDRDPPARWPISLPDLRSRLSAVPILELQPPDDDLLIKVLAKHFSDRNQTVGDEVLYYIVRRIERSFAAAASIVRDIDRAALAQKRMVTLSLVREAMAIEPKD